MTGDITDLFVPETEPLSHAVVVTVAAQKGVDPLDLDDRLYDCIDPDALDALFSSTGQDACGTVQFLMAGCQVEVSAQRRVTVQQFHEESSTTEARV